MKKITTILAFLLVTITLQSQVLLNESFDGTTFPPTGWINQLTSGSVTWSRQSSGTYPSCAPHSGAAMAQYDSYNATANSSALLITPSVNLSGLNGVTKILGFWIYRDASYSTNSDNITVYVNTTASVTAATQLGIINRSTSLSPAVAAAGWYYYTYTIPSTFTGINNYFIFKATSQYGARLNIDDVVVKTQQQYATLPYSQTFDGSWVNYASTKDVPDLYWRNEIATGILSWRRNDEGSTANWTTSNGSYTPTGAESTLKSARFHSYDIGSGSSSSFSLHVNMAPIGGKTLTFSYLNVDGTDNLKVSLSTDDGVTFTDLKTLYTAATWKTYQIFLGEITSSKAIIKFKATSDYGYTDIGLDQINIKIQNLDSRVSAFVNPNSTVSPGVQNVSVKIKNSGLTTLTSAQIGWSVNGVAQTSYNYTSAGLTTSVESTPISLGNYSFATTGTYNIKAWTKLPNGLADNAAYNDTLLFSVYVDGPASLPYLETFEGVTSPSVPAGILVTDNNSDNVKWETSTSVIPVSGVNQMRIVYNSTKAMDDWFYTPAFYFTAGKTYEVSFWYKSGGWTEKLEVKCGNTKTPAGMVNSIFYNNAVTSSTYQKATATIVASYTGTYYVGFHGFSSMDQLSLYVDDISVKEFVATAIESVKSVDSESISLYPNPVGDILNVDSQFEFNNVYIVNSLGVIVWSGNSQSFPLNTSDFKSGVYTIAFEKEGKRIVEKFIKL